MLIIGESLKHLYITIVKSISNVCGCLELKITVGSMRQSYSQKVMMSVCVYVLDGYM